MRTLIAILTGLHVLAHGVFGCCDHGQNTASTKAPSCICHHEDHAGHEHGESGDRHADDLAETTGNCLATDDDSPRSAPHRCIHASCHWLTGDIAASHHDFDFNRMLALDADSASLASELTSAAFWPDANCVQFSAPPLRLHLALGVLLI